MRTRRTRPDGNVTRGTTAPNRLRRVDRWLLGTHARPLLRADRPLVVDLGFGATPVTTVELFHRLRALRPDVEVVGVEIDPARVAAARAAEQPGLSFRLGGFELPVDRPPVVVRAFNVLRQYEESVVGPVWARLAGALAPDGLLVEGTCDEIGRRAVWVELGPRGPRTVTFAARIGSLPRPGEFAERLPKALIHRNVPGEPVHAFLTSFDRAWDHAAGLAAFGGRQRWAAAVAELRGEWPVRGGPRRWRLGEVTVDWSAVAPTTTAVTGAPSRVRAAC